MSKLVRLWTDDTGRSQFSEGHLDLPPTAVTTIHAEETAAHGALDWHVAPCRQYVVTLTGTLRFTTRDGGTFVLAPGDVLLAEDTAGSGHRWELTDDQPWRRLYVQLV